ncbi:HdeD family acid-resistance protein [Commensalibacter oyaizuii]|uniref:HdeD family acid-resistance protein n=1 Tax=Commensalibacter oyaizuii TaxID=3043873 RepID=A0ABT6PZC1_9PROT|nr:HdeD family acid-resistance protein [Commensalibacter sp. TBRC 16381]MDI2090214.1 HdeD family acid-resistance protein [Commensalibacter sp. TBRC 16381]
MEQLLAQKWKWFVGLGSVILVLGFFALLDTAVTTIASVIILGIVLVFAGLSQIIHACYLNAWKSFLLSALAGIVYLASGIILICAPVAGSLILTAFIAVCFCIGGVMRIMIAINHKGSGGWGFLCFSGALSVILGLFLLAEPLSGLWFIGFMIAFDLMFIGAAWIQLGLTFKQKIK